MLPKDKGGVMSISCYYYSHNIILAAIDIIYTRDIKKESRIKPYSPYFAVNTLSDKNSASSHIS